MRERIRPIFNAHDSGSWKWLGTLAARKGVRMRFGPFLALAILLFILWVGGFVVLHGAGMLIHLLLVFAVISIMVHLFTGSRTA